MTFRPDWRAPAMWLLLSATNVVLAFERFHKHGWHDGYAWFQLVLWSAVLVAWSLTLNQRWRFTADRLVIERFLLPDRTIHYEAICSVDWNIQRNISITVSERHMALRTKRLTVTARDMPGFLSEMERYVPSQVIHV